MNERLPLSALAGLTLLSLLLAPWAAISREIGGRSTLLLLPGRILDFSGRTEAFTFPAAPTVFALSIVALLVLVATALIRTRLRFGLYLFAGLLLLGVTFYGLGNFGGVLLQARAGVLLETIESTLVNPADRLNVAMLEEARTGLYERPFAESLALVRDSGVRVRRVPYEGAGMGLAAFMAIVTGIMATVFSVRAWPAGSRALDRALVAAAVPAVSILLALVAAAVVVLALQATPRADGVAVTGVGMYLAGRLDTLWHAYQTLFATSLGSFTGFLEALRFATPLIMTGLAVAFGFRAGLFNIGAPGQMVLGGIFAMLAGLYLPGPRWVVLPLAIAAAALGGGLWGGLAGWLKARFGANEVINTILLNYIAASLLLFILTSTHVFAAAAWRMLWVIVGFIVLVAVLNLIPSLRTFFRRSPRLVFAISGVLLLGAMVYVGNESRGDAPVTVNLPFKAPGSEPKSHTLRMAARLPQLPAVVGIDQRATPGTNIVPIDYTAPLAAVVALIVFTLVPLLGGSLGRLWLRTLVAVLAGFSVYSFAMYGGLNRLPTAIPPTNLNGAFLIALSMAFFMHYLLWRTKWGYELRAVGLAPKAAEYGGASIARNTIMAMFISGAFAGLTATHYVLGGALEDYALRQALPVGDGFDGIAVALLGGNTPFGVVLAAFLFGVLRNGGSILNITFADLTRDVVSMILALVVLFIAARGFLPERLTNPLRRVTENSDNLNAGKSQPLDPPGKPLRTQSQEAK